jgi:hypothetical protein
MKCGKYVGKGLAPFRLAHQCPLPHYKPCENLTDTFIYYKQAIIDKVYTAFCEKQFGKRDKFVVILVVIVLFLSIHEKFFLLTQGIQYARGVARKRVCVKVRDTYRGERIYIQHLCKYLLDEYYYET